MEKLRQKIYLVFSDTVMIALALFVIPLVAVQTFFILTPAQETLVRSLDWLIWTAFFLEFSLKLLVAEKRARWFIDNWLDSLISIVVIVSPLLELFAKIFEGAPLLRLLRLTRITRLTRLSRLARLGALGVRTQKSWRNLELKVYLTFFLIVGIGLVSSFFGTKIRHSGPDAGWISLFLSLFGAFYAFLVSFFIAHVWLRFSFLSGEIGKHVNSLQNVVILTKQFSSEEISTNFIDLLDSYLEETVRLWGGDKNIIGKTLKKKLLKIISCFKEKDLQKGTDLVILDNIFEELRTSSVAQTNISGTIDEKTPLILWIILIFLSLGMDIGFVFLGFDSQILATLVITSIFTISALITAFLLDIDKPLEAGFWHVSPKPYEDLKEFIKELKVR